MYTEQLESIANSLFTIDKSLKVLVAHLIANKEASVPKARRKAPAKRAGTGVARTSTSCVTQELNLVRVYCDAFKAEYGSSPTITGKDAGRLTRLAFEIGVEKASHLIQVYLQIRDPWFKKRYHDINTFFLNMNQISVALKSGKSPAEVDWGRVFKGEQGDGTSLQTTGR